MSKLFQLIFLTFATPTLKSVIGIFISKNVANSAFGLSPNIILKSLKMNILLNPPNFLIGLSNENFGNEI